MEINEYQKLAMRTLNPEIDKKELILNASMGLCGESGEVIDLVKKLFVTITISQGNRFAQLIEPRTLRFLDILLCIYVGKC